MSTNIILIYYDCNLTFIARCLIVQIAISYRSCFHWISERWLNLYALLLSLNFRKSCFFRCAIVSLFYIKLEIKDSGYSLRILINRKDSFMRRILTCIGISATILSIIKITNFCIMYKEICIFPSQLLKISEVHINSRTGTFVALRHICDIHLRMVCS